MPKANVIVFDTETTGIDCNSDRLVEIAGVTIGREVELEFTTLVNPERGIPPEAQAIHHITPSDIVGAPSEVEAVAAFFEAFAPVDPEDPTILVAHNAKFDAGFISRIDPERKLYYIDTLKMAYVAFQDSPSFGNQVLRYYLNLAVTVPPTLFPHRALYDCIVTREIFRLLMTRFTLNEMVKISANPVILPRVNFGKHKGKRWDEVDYGYLRWCSQNMKDDENVLHTVTHYMHRR